MSESTMRGTRLGGQSYESERNVTFEQRTKHTYQCLAGHNSELTFSVMAEVPQTWDCKTCAQTAYLLVDGVLMTADATDAKKPRSHWEMLLERRTLAELQELLDEQLASVRAKREAAMAAAALSR